MIVVRDVFRLRFGRARDARAILQEALGAAQSSGYRVDRLLTDVTGEYYTLVMESSYPDLGAYEAALREVSGNDAWKEAYARFVPLVLSGRREVLRVVD